ncbi:galactoside O-acetyltransferase [Cellulomonas gilvus ATCC 13127]|uniref:Acetyltransferase n=2 Tax=Cellulomonas gilvus TaxID=11 RepID=F8A6J6_CELGA|nr:galactoside O-acetyltransferase [Cellulomonas gilvus ATCC 13127]
MAGWLWSIVHSICTIDHMTTPDYFAGDPRTQRERMLAGDLYIADDPENERIARRATVLVDEYHRAVVAADDERARSILAELLGSLGEGAFIKPPLAVDYGENIHVGARTFVNSGLTALDVATITIGEDCQIGPQVQLLTPTHPVDPQPRRDKLEAAQPITLGDNVWLGGGVIVCPGVTIGENTVVGAGSVVVRDLPANVVAVGNPARVVRTITPGEQR